MDKSKIYVEAYRIKNYQKHSGLSDMVAFMSDNDLCREYFSPFQEKLDYLQIPEQQFIVCLDNLPVNLGLFTFDYQGICQQSRIPLNYDSYVYMANCFFQEELHTHQYYEIVYVWKGMCEQSIDDTTHQLIAGDVMIIPPNILHKTVITDQTSIVVDILICRTTLASRYSALLVDNNIFSSFFKAVLYSKKSPRYFIVHTDNDYILKRIIRHLFTACYTIVSTSLCRNTDVTAVLLLLFGYLQRYGSVPEIDMPNFNKQDGQTIYDIFQYMQLNYQTVTLRSLSELFHFNEQYICKIIKCATGENFLTHKNKIRFQNAQDLLQQTNLTLAEICSRIGFSDVSNFSKSFKRYIGMTPVQYRKLS